MLEEREIKRRQQDEEKKGDVEMMLRTNEKLKKDKESDCQEKHETRKLLVDLAKSMVYKKSRLEEEKKQELANEQRASLEQEMLLKRENDYKAEMIRKRNDHLKTLDCIAQKVSYITTKEKTRDLEEEKKENSRLKRMEEQEKIKEKYVKEAERETKVALDRIVEETRRKKEMEKNKEKEFAIRLRQKCERDAQIEQEKVERRKKAKLSNQNDIRRQMQERQIRTQCISDYEMKVNEKLIKQAADLLNN